MQIGLIDVDGHNFPNLALMRISAYHKSIGDTVEWWWSDLIHYDIVYKSKVFSDAYSKDAPDPINADVIIRGGTGYAIETVNGREVFHQNHHDDLAPLVEQMFPDYSIYPQYNFAVAMTSRGCPRACSFCHVAAKEGRCSVKVADLDRFWNGTQKHIEVLDPNITACPDKRDLFAQYREAAKLRSGTSVTFNQGLDIRCIDGYDIEDLNQMAVKELHFAWDNPKQNLEKYFDEFSKDYRRKYKGMVYILTNFDSTMEENLYRIYTVFEKGFLPYVMIYDKQNAPKEIKRLQRWCNNRIIFKSCKRFEDYKG